MPEQSTNPPSPLLTEHSRPIGSADFERVLHVLDFEIDRIQTEQQRPGWSIWAIYGALGTSIWLLSEQIASATASLTNVLQLLIGFSAGGFLFDVIAMAAPIKKAEVIHEGRFRWFGDSANRRVVLVDAFRLTATTLLILLVTAGISWPQFVTALAVFGMMALLNFAVGCHVSEVSCNGSLNSYRGDLRTCRRDLHLDG